MATRAIRLFPARAARGLALALVGHLVPIADADAQTQVLFTEGFENGAPGWAFPILGAGVPVSLWHLAAPVPLLCNPQVVSTMCVYNTSPCNYQNGFTHDAAADSPLFTLSAEPPFILSFKYMRSVDSAGSTQVQLFHVETGTYHVVYEPKLFGTFPHPESVVLPAWVHPGDEVGLRFRFLEDSIGNGGFGWLIDEILLTGSAPQVWSSLGSGLAGGSGVPELEGFGPLTVGSPAKLSLTNAKPSSPAALFFAISSTPAPFKGGLLVPVPPAYMLALTTSTGGSHVLNFGWLPGVPSGTTVEFQYAIVDPAAVNGVALSNAVQGLIP